MEADGSGRRSLHDCSLSPERVVVGLEACRLLRLRGRDRHLDTVDGTLTQLSDCGDAELVSGRVDHRVRRRAQAVRHPGGGWDAATARHPQACGLRCPRLVAGFPARRLCLLGGAAVGYSLWTIRADGSGGRRVAQNVAEDDPQLVARRISHRLPQVPRPLRDRALRGPLRRHRLARARAREPHRRGRPADPRGRRTGVSSCTSAAASGARRTRTSTPFHRPDAGAGR